MIQDRQVAKIVMRLLRFVEEKRRLTIPCPRVITRDGRGRPIEWCGTVMEWRTSRAPRFRPKVVEHVYVCPACEMVEIVVEKSRPTGLVPLIGYIPPWRRAKL